MNILHPRRRLLPLLTAGLCLLSLAAAPAAAQEGAGAGLPEAPSALHPSVQPGRAESAPEPELEQLLLRASGLLAGLELTREQHDALCLRAAGQPRFLELLERSELSGQELALLALPNGRLERLERYGAWAREHPDQPPETVVLQVNMDQDLPLYTGAQAVPVPDSLEALVNKRSALPEDYVPELTLLGSLYGCGSLRPEAAQAFQSMADAARADGVSLRSVSAYRSFQAQEDTYNRWLRQYRQATVDTFSARPGLSEHQTGLALDINVASSRAHFENTPAFAWLKEHCAEYGFILRYDQGKEAITGYRFEPWHYRYVGVETASACMSQGLAYEEYLALRPEEYQLLPPMDPAAYLEI